MKETTSPFEPREWLAAVRDIFGDSYIIRLFGVTIRTYQRWTARRPWASEDSIKENYLEKHEQLLHRLMGEPGGVDIARACVTRHAEIVGCLVQITEVTPDKDNISDEMLDDHPPLVELHNAIQSGEAIEEVRSLAEKAKHEIDETVELYKFSVA